jgi:hypothetical protein
MKNKTPNHFFKTIKILAYALLLVVGISTFSSVQSLWWERNRINIEVNTGDWTVPRSHGYWKHQYDSCSCSQSNGNKLDNQTLESYLANITSRSQIFNFSNTTLENFQEAYAILSLGGPSQENLLKRELLALWLNTVSGYTEGYRLTLSNGTSLTSEQVIGLAEQALLNGDTTEYEQLKDLCEEFNTKWDN